MSFEYDKCENGQPYTVDEFVALVQQEISVACALPFTVPVKEIERIIKFSSVSSKCI